MASSSTTKATTFYTQSGTDKAIAAAIAGIKPPDVSGLAKKSDVASAYQLKGDYALRSDIPDVSGLAKKSDVASAYQLKGDYATATALSEGLAGKADKADIPSLDGLAKASDVEALSAKVDGLGAAVTSGFLVLGPTDEVPSGTPADTVIVRRSA